VKITFNGITLAADFSDGGTDSVDGFLIPSGKQNVQWAEALRATDAIPIARGNRKHTLTGTIIPQTADTLEDAMIAKGLIFVQLPSTGALSFYRNGKEITFPIAVLESIEVLKDSTRGISYGYQLTFQCNAPVQTNLSVQTDAGVNIETDSGTQINS
jgi:hypothetical protein